MVELTPSSSKMMPPPPSMPSSRSDTPSSSTNARFYPGSRDFMPDYFPNHQQQQQQKQQHNAPSSSRPTSYSQFTSPPQSSSVAPGQYDDSQRWVPEAAQYLHGQRSQDRSYEEGGYGRQTQGFGQHPPPPQQQQRFEQMGAPPPEFGPPPSPRSAMLMYHQQQQQQQQQQPQHQQHQQQHQQQGLQHSHPPHSQHPHNQYPQLHHFGPPHPAHHLGSGLMSNSGQPAEEITTVFIVGFPDDMTEREFANMFLFARGFEASTLKIPVGGMGGPGPGQQRSDGMFGSAIEGQWDESPYAAAAGGKIKQIIGFAKFRTRSEALEARDALNGKKIDAERGCVLKTEMAKKNLHTKQRPVLAGGNTSGSGSGPAFEERSGMPYGGAPFGGGNGSANQGMMRNMVGGLNGGAAPFAPPPGPQAAGSSGPFANDRDVQGGSNFFSASVDETFSPHSNSQSYGRSDGPHSGPLSASEQWPPISRGPLDYFAPTESTTASTAPKAETRQQREGSGGSTSRPRGPDWSAIGSPTGMFGSARSYATPTSPTKSASRRDAEGGELSSLSTSPPNNSVLSPSRASDGSQGQRSARSPGSDGVPVASGFASRFGSLRLEADSAAGLSVTSPTTSQTPTSQTKAQATTQAAPQVASSQTPSSQVASSQAPSSQPTSSQPPASSQPPGSLPSPTSRSFSIDQNPPGNTLFVGNLPSNLSSAASSSLEDQLRRRFQACDGYRQMSYRTKNNGPMCFVEFDDVQNAARALAAVNGDSIGGSVKNGGLRLSFSKNPLFRNSSTGGVAIVGGAGAGAGAGATSKPLSPQYASLGRVSESLEAANGDDCAAADDDEAEDLLDSANTLEETSYRQGFDAGSAHGQLHGTFEGRALGREQGFEIWDEVGFYEGTARFWRGVLAKQVENQAAESRSRKQIKQLQHLEALETLIAAFPMRNRSGVELPEQAGAGGATTMTEISSADGAAPVEDAETLSKMDMSALLERIRARYKVVCASLGIPARDGPVPPPAHQGARQAPQAQQAVVAGRTVDTSQLRF